MSTTDPPESDADADRDAYEYHLMNVKTRGLPEEVEERINGLGQNGWRIVERIDLRGMTTYLIFERPAIDSDPDPDDE